ncbi:MAG TPA: hypothetical protein DCG14_02390, partial [Phycisphaerales bacterium]|nr:hypothetical protein [Phycisphaerales bacterium]
RLLRYLRVQRQQGYWRVALHLEHPGRGGNAYSGPIDHLQPFVAAAFVPSLLAIAWPPWGAVVPATMLLVLVLMQLPMTRAMVRRGGWSMAWFVPLGTIRAIWRAIGLVQGVLDRLLRRGAIGSGGIRT